MDRRSVMLALAVGLLVPRPAGADPSCFGRCVHESPGFTSTVVDKESSQPIADVHVLVEWVYVGNHRGPLVVQHTVTSADGVVTVRPWGPVQGYRMGLELGMDPVVSFFKPGYRFLVVNNVFPPGSRETDRVHRFWADGRTLTMEPFHGSSGEWVTELQKAARIQAPMISDELMLQFRDPYGTRFRLVRNEMNKLPEPLRAAAKKGTLLENRLNFLERPLP